MLRHVLHFEAEQPWGRHLWVLHGYHARHEDQMQRFLPHILNGSPDGPRESLTSDGLLKLWQVEE